ncbi:hypothetical protein [Nannocystis bainbridge]|uniref:Uncharacterized protein n=1 Tax=Nannocystis bainbridge TaxID=2995303 RepID=A0ABT5DU70_9BACT|nr:hypothetical protein [Nannocystis bainbridge]MDC0716690.1 hypothetical protein [Nannocystis bainbridge]
MIAPGPGSKNVDTIDSRQSLVHGRTGSKESYDNILRVRIRLGCENARTHLRHSRSDLVSCDEHGQPGRRPHVERICRRLYRDVELTRMIRSKPASLHFDRDAAAFAETPEKPSGAEVHPLAKARPR